MVSARGCLGAAGLVTALVASMMTTQAEAQSMAPPGVGLDVTGTFAQGWSPLRRIADPERLHPLDLAAAAAHLLERATPLGLASDAGNPAGLAFEVSEPSGTVVGRLRDRSGEFRRPLDPGEMSGRDVVAIGSAPLGERTAGAGTLGAHWGRDLTPAYANLTYPHTPSPHVLADTSLSSMETMGATVEGGVAGRLGDWSLGVAAGVRARDTRSIAAVVRRVRRHTEPGVAVGIARELSGSAVRVGLHGSVLREATTIVLHPLAAPTRVLRLRGFAEPIPNDIIGQYFHRLSRTQRTVGAAAAGAGGDLQWVAAVEVGSLDEGQFHEARNDPARQRWKSDVVRTSVRVGTPVRGAGWVQVGAARASLDGRAHRPDIESATFSSRDRDWEAEGLVRIPVATHWWWTGEGTVHRINRHQRDHDLRVSASLEAWNTSIGMGLTFEPREGLWIGAAHKWTRYVPAGRVPLPSSVGELTRAFVLPQYILHATEARVHSTVLRIDYATGSRGTLSASLNRGTSSPTEATATAFALTPEGRRDDWEVRFAWSPAR